ncbi:hypothetical protein TWF481_011384 [Arthrobotrys musiformis]|uniref:Uncharacterized protein n=1 Tax=Arthrobotrys musiformis TaxID=47236 RepID=A0AAV9VZL5_9PEZI
MGRLKNRNRNVHAVVLYGSDKWDVNCAYNFVSAIRSCYSRSIIPYTISSCERDEILGTIRAAHSEDDSQDARVDYLSSSVPFFEEDSASPVADPEVLPETQSTPTANNGDTPPDNPLRQSIPTPQESQEILEVLRPFYHCVPYEDLKLELRSHLQALSQKLKPSSGLLIIICAQAVHSSGCIVLGRSIGNQDMMEYIDSLPLNSTAVIASIAPGSDDRKEIPEVWETSGELGSEGMQRHFADTGVVYTTARVEIIKPTTEFSVGREVLMVKDTGVARLKRDIFSDSRPVKLTPWTYRPDEWNSVNSVTGYVEGIIDQHIISKHDPFAFLKDTIDRGVRIVKSEEPLDLTLYYLELKLEEMKKRNETDEGAEGMVYERARKGMLALEGIMKRVVDQNRDCLHAAHIISSSSLFQQRVEETLRFLERTDVRAQAFLQGAYKMGMLKFIDESETRLHAEAKERLLESVNMLCIEFNTILIPPKDCVGIEYWDQADRVLRIIQGHISQFRWFRIESFMEYMAVNL